jgi:SET domain-containing protein
MSYGRFGLSVRDLAGYPSAAFSNDVGDTMALRSSWMSAKLEVRQSAAHRKGVFATQPIPKAERLAIFGGDIMWIDEIKSLPDSLRSYPMQIEERFVLGARHATEPEDADFFNHSCNPNCGFKGQLFLVAMRDIALGEEVTFDYAMVVSRSVDSDIVFEMTCHCGAAECRKVITEADWMRADLQRRYRDHFSQYLQEKIERLTGWQI